MNLQADITALRAQHQSALKRFESSVATLTTADEVLLTRTKNVFGAALGKYDALVKEHDANILTLESNDKKHRAADAKGEQRADLLDLALADAKATLSAQLKAATDAHAADVAQLGMDDVAIAAQSATDIDGLAKTVGAANKKLGDRIQAVVDQHDTDVAALQANDASLTYLDVATGLRVNALHVAYAMGDAALVQKLNSAEEAHGATIALLKLKDEAIVARMVSAKKTVLADTAAVDGALTSALDNQREAVAAQLEAAATDRAAVRAELAAADTALRAKLSALRAAHSSDVASLGAQHADLTTKATTLRGAARDKDVALGKKLAATTERMALLELVSANADAVLAGLTAGGSAIQCWYVPERAQ